MGKKKDSDTTLMAFLEIEKETKQLLLKEEITEDEATHRIRNARQVFEFLIYERKRNAANGGHNGSCF